MSEKKSIKETLEMLEGMGEAAAIVKKIAEGGLSIADLAHIKDVAAALPVMKEAVDGADEIPAELKDLDKVEVTQIIGAIYSQAKKINKA